MQQYYQYLTILLTFTIFLTVYFLDYSHNRSEEVALQSSDELGNTENSSQQLKTVVAYSLLKQIENEHLEIECPHRGRSGEYVERLRSFPNGQWRHVKDTSVHVYSAYPDHRVKSFVYIRFIAMLKDEWKHSLYCQFHSSTSSLLKVIRASRIDIWSSNWRNPDKMMPVLFSCPSTLSNFKSVTISANPCKISDLKYNIDSEKPEKVSSDRLKVMVCVKPLKFPLEEDIFDKLLTWLEMNNLLGVKQFDIYVNSVSKKVLKLLKWYRDVRKTVNVNILTYVNPTLTSDISNVTALWQKRKHELVAYNDCFYRNIHRANFVIPLDLDEIIVPKIHRTYQELLGNLTISSKYSSISVKNAFFFHKNFNYNLFDTIFRTKFSAPYRSGKSFINTSNTLIVFNHYSLQPLYPGVSKTYFINESLAQLNHYRQGCDLKLLPEDCNRIMNSSPVFDDTVLRFKEQFFDRFVDVGKQLKLSINVL